jgi:acetyltransferase
MSVRNFDLLFQPRSIAVVGASDRAGSVGYVLLRNLVQGGYQGAIYPLNPQHDEIQGLRCFADATQLPQAPDLAIVAVRAPLVANVIEQLAQAGNRTAVVISAGYGEIGAAGRQLEQQLADTLRRHPGYRVLGPNCLGFLAPRLHLNASFAAGTPQPGRVAFVSQSGALCTATLDWALSEEIGFSYFISLGNQLDIDFADLLDYLADDSHTESLVLYVESIRRARKFVSAARAFTRRKPIVVYKAGRFAQSAQAAASHTGALAGLDAAYDAAFRRAAMVRVYDSEEIFGCAELLARTRPPRGARLAIVTNAGGPGVMATDELIEHRGQLAELMPATIDALQQLLPPAWSHGNPVDVLGDAPPERFAAACQVVVRDPQVDGLLAILTPQAMTQPTPCAEQMAAAVAGVHKPTLAAWMGGPSVAAARSVLNAQHIPTLDTPEQAVRSFLYLASYARDLETLYQAPKAVPLPFTRTPAERCQALLAECRDRSGTLTQTESKAILDIYDIPHTRPLLARSAAEARQAALELGFPLVMKLLSPDITHKSDVGGVRLNLHTVDDVEQAFGQIMAGVQQARPTARVAGVTLERYLDPLDGVELILGCRRDATFGPVIMVGYGGVATELFRDCSFELPPIDERLAARLLERLRCWPLLTGYRGRPAMAIDRLIETLLRFSTLIAELPQLAELDINPLLVTPHEVVALDARVVLDAQQVQPGEPLYAHLAIAPYPIDLVEPVVLTDGTPVVIRPIRPEDEPAWHAMLDAASDHSIRQRFRAPVRGSVHLQAARYCFIDYDREMAFVVEAHVAGAPQLVGVGRLVADREHETAEFAVLVIDAWHRRGLGSRLLDKCLAHARAIGIHRVRAETSWDNVPMLGLFRARGFTLHRAPNDPTTVLAELPLRD